VPIGISGAYDVGPRWVATRDGMWQFRLAEGSAFRLELALGRWLRGAGR
jgi:hypothetical protein